MHVTNLWGSHLSGFAWHLWKISFHPYWYFHSGFVRKKCEVWLPGPQPVPSWAQALVSLTIILVPGKQQLSWWSDSVMGISGPIPFSALSLPQIPNTYTRQWKKTRNFRAEQPGENTWYSPSHSHHCTHIF